MNTAKTLRTIEADLLASIEEPVPDIEAIKIAARRIGAQAEMIEEGIV